MELNVSNWAVIRPEQGGRDQEKLWLGPEADVPRAAQWLWKPRLRTGGTAWRANDAAEVITSRLAWSMGLPAADCRYAVRNGELGALSCNVTPPDFSLHDGGTYLSEVDGYVNHDSGGRLHQDEGYTLDAVEQVLEGLTGPPGWTAMSAFELFSGYLVLDALIANTDRHPRNWALLENEPVNAADTQKFLAPTFDHGTALGSGLTDQGRQQKTSQQQVPAWCAAGKSNPFTPRISLLDLAREAVERSGAVGWLDRIEDLRHPEIREMMRAPRGRLSQEASTFIEQVLLENRRRLCTCPR